MSRVNVAFGGGSIVAGGCFSEPAILHDLYKVLQEGGCDTIDTSSIYREGERLLSETGAVGRFTINTKTPGNSLPGRSTSERDSILEDGEKSLKLLGQIDVYYLHAPNYATPIEDTLEAIETLYKQGVFRRFGLSNFKPEDVQLVYDLSKEKGWVLPTVYQGSYNAAARMQGEILFPTLRKLNMAFNAYSPLAGGFLSKSAQDIADERGDHFKSDTFGGKLYRTLYARPALVGALAEWQSIADDESISRAELGYRWICYHSQLSSNHGDGIIIGASSVQQAQSTLTGLRKGPLSQRTVERIDAFWDLIKLDAPNIGLAALLVPDHATIRLQTQASTSV